MTSLVQKHGSQYKVIKRERSLGGGGGQNGRIAFFKSVPIYQKWLMGKQCHSVASS